MSRLLPTRVRRKLFAAFIVSVATIGQHIHWRQAGAMPFETVAAKLIRH